MSINLLSSTQERPFKTGGIAVIFPGQGSQKVGMAKDFYDNFPESRRVFDQASIALGIDMSELCFTANAQLNLTEFTQPAILTAEIAIFEALKNCYGIYPVYLAGHSLGEYTALVAAGAINLSDAVQIVRARGALMQTAVPQGLGAMVAVISNDIDVQNIEELCEEYSCDIANYNSLEQLVISGPSERIRACSKAIELLIPGTRIVPLNVSAPFHSSLMHPIEKSFEALLGQFLEVMKLRSSINVFSNYTGELHTSGNAVKALVKQISSPVRWMDNMKNLIARTSTIIEIGPQRVLGKFFTTLNIDVPSITDLRSMDRYFLNRVSHAV